jgi:4-hydroxyacetophenone monooxygenase
MLYGPNTNPFSLGVVNFEEIAEWIVDRKSTVEVSHDGYWRFNNDLDEREALKTWSDRRDHSYYKNEFERSASNCPFLGTEMWAWLKQRRTDEVLVG